jgi:polyprenyl P-hydroxybenzoate/phenylacrylic acid decarboxylase-like protein
MKRLVVGISGASASRLGLRLLDVLRSRDDVETHLVVSKGAWRALALEEPEFARERVLALADYSYDDRDLAAPIASGSFLHDGMAIVPASMKTCGALAYGNAENLLVRAADVALKERRTLIVAPRESPLHYGHLKTLARLSKIGAIIAPPMLATYHAPKTVDDLFDHAVGKVLDLLGVPHDLFKRWSGGTKPSDSE